MKRHPLVYIVALVYNGKKWLDNCLSSVLASDYPNFRTLVVDNASGDGSADYVEKNFHNAEVIRSIKNCGTGGGYNMGIRHALHNGAEYVLLLNQDTIVDKNWITELVNLAQRDSSMGILAPIQYDYEDKERLSPTVQRFLESDMAKGKGEGYVEMEKIVGAAMLVTKPFIEKVGIFDPFYFMYTDENDLVRRGWYHGFKSVFALKSKIYHWDHLLHNMNPKSAVLFDRNQLIEALKDPRHALLRNLFVYYINLFRECRRKEGLRKGIIGFLRFLWRQKECILFLPLIAVKRYREKRFPCYLEKG